MSTYRESDSLYRGASELKTYSLESTVKYSRVQAFCFGNWALLLCGFGGILLAGSGRAGEKGRFFEDA